MTALVNPGLAAELERSDEFNADACMNCGVCSAICPMGVDVLPRKLFRYVLLGMEDQVRAETESVFSCLLCKMCEENCPAGRAHRRERAHPAPSHRPHRLRPRGGMTMPLPTGDVIGILADNLRLRKSVLPLSAKVATKWTEGLGLPRGGETVLYTGLMYQLIPYIEGLVKAEIKLGDSWLAKYTGLGRKVNRVVNVSAFMARPSAEERAALRPGADQRRPPAAQGRRRVRLPSTRTTSTPAPWPTTWALDEVVAEHARASTRSSRSTA